MLTEQEFIDWVGDGWAEWVNGEVIIMSPVNFEHAELHSFLVHAAWRLCIGDHEQGALAGHASHFKFALPKPKSRRYANLISFFISNKRRSNLRYAHLEGAPDLIVEIICSG